MPRVTMSEGTSWIASAILGIGLLKLLWFRVQDGFYTGLDSDGPIPVELNFVGSVWSLGRVQKEGAFRRLNKFGFPPWPRMLQSGNKARHSSRLCDDTKIQTDVGYAEFQNISEAVAPMDAL